MYVCVCVCMSQLYTHTTATHYNPYMQHLYTILAIILFYHTPYACQLPGLPLTQATHRLCDLFLHVVLYRDHDVGPVHALESIHTALPCTPHWLSHLLPCCARHRIVSERKEDEITTSSFYLTRTPMSHAPAAVEVWGSIAY